MVLAEDARTPQSHTPDMTLKRGIERMGIERPGLEKPEEKRIPNNVNRGVRKRKSPAFKSRYILSVAQGSRSARKISIPMTGLLMSDIENEKIFHGYSFLSSCSNCSSHF